MMPDLAWGMARTGWDPWNVFRRTRFMRGKPFDLIHAFDSRPAVIHPALAHRSVFGTPVVLDWADWWGAGGIISQRSNFFLRNIFSHVEIYYEEAFRTRVNWNTVISSRLAARAEALGVPAERITVLPAGADLDYFKPMAMKGAREQLGLPVDGHILTFGGFVQWDLDFVLASFEHITKMVPDTILLLCGPTTSLTRKWKSHHPALAAQVHEVGIVPIEEMPQYLAAADVLLMPLTDSVANRARFPNKLGEYLAMGKPVVTNLVGDAPEMLRRTDAGVLAPSEPVAFAHVIEELLADKERCFALGQRAQLLAAEELDYRILTIRLLEAYGKI